MSGLPIVATHDWVADSVGGSSNDPVVLKLVEDNLITNGDFEEALSGWSNESGTAPSRYDAGVLAAKGNYVMKVPASSVTHKAIAFTGTKILLTGFVKFTDVDAAGSCDITLYISDSATYVAAPASKSVKVVIDSVDTLVDATDYFMPFYLELEDTAGTHVHINIAVDASTEVHLDDFRLYEVSEKVALYAPNSMSVRYQKAIDAQYELFDGTDKEFSRGWRPIYSIGYNFITAAGLVKNIGLSESTFNFFIPHSNNMNGSYVRAQNDFDGRPFNGRYNGHENDLELKGLFLQKYKPREYGSGYFTVTIN